MSESFANKPQDAQDSEAKQAANAANPNTRSAASISHPEAKQAAGEGGASGAEPSDTEPSSAESSDAKPATAEPSSAIPSAAKPPSAEPSSANLSAAKPPSAEPSSANLSAAKPPSAEPSRRAAQPSESSQEHLQEHRKEHPERAKERMKPSDNLKPADHMKLSEILELSFKAEQDLSIGTLLQYLDSKSFGVLLMALTIICALPVPVIGYNIPLGFFAAVVAFQGLLGYPRPRLPKFLLSFKLRHKWMAHLEGPVGKVLRVAENFVQPRNPSIQKPWIRIGVYFVIFVLAIILMIPIPLANSIPALVIFAIGLGISEEDGLLTSIGACVGALVAIFGSIYIYIILFLLQKIIS